MITIKYPEWIEAQLKYIDERIVEMYNEYEGQKFKPDEAMQIKRNLYERMKPFVDEKVRLISNSYPTYIVDRMPKKEYEAKIEAMQIKRNLMYERTKPKEREETE